MNQTAAPLNKWGAPRGQMTSVTRPAFHLVMRFQKKLEKKQP